MNYPVESGRKEKIQSSTDNWIIRDSYKPISLSGDGRYRWCRSVILATVAAKDDKKLNYPDTYIKYLYWHDLPDWNECTKKSKGVLKVTFNFKVYKKVIYKKRYGNTVFYNCEKWIMFGYCCKM